MWGTPPRRRRAVWVAESSAAGSGTIANSIVANNTNGQADIFMDVFGIDGGNNLITDGDGTIFTNGVNGDIGAARDTYLLGDFGTFGDHGGETPTLALNSTSPAIDAADVSTATTLDQRGTARSGAPDIGPASSTPPRFRP